MKNRSFEYVYTVFQEGSFSKAAAKLYISQPALSAAIKKVETELYGVPLFNRGVNPVTLHLRPSRHYKTVSRTQSRLYAQPDRNRCHGHGRKAKVGGA